MIHFKRLPPGRREKREPVRGAEGAGVAEAGGAGAAMQWETAGDGNRFGPGRQTMPHRGARTLNRLRRCGNMRNIDEEKSCNDSPPVSRVLPSSPPMPRPVAR
jgi:hypothetical protein